MDRSSQRRRRTSGGRASSPLGVLGRLLQPAAGLAGAAHPGTPEVLAGVSIAAVALRMACAFGMPVRRGVSVAAMIALAAELIARGVDKSNVRIEGSTGHRNLSCGSAPDPDLSGLLERIMPDQRARDTRPQLTAQVFTHLGPESQN